MQGIHTHIPETNYVPRGYTVAAILCFYGASISSSCVGSFVPSTLVIIITTVSLKSNMWHFERTCNHN